MKTIVNMGKRDFLHTPYDPNDPKDRIIATMTKNIIEKLKTIEFYEESMSNTKKIKVRIAKKEYTSDDIPKKGMQVGDIYAYDLDCKWCVVILSIVPQHVIKHNTFEKLPSDDMVIYAHISSDVEKLIMNKESIRILNKNDFMKFYTRIAGKNIFDSIAEEREETKKFGNAFNDTPAPMIFIMSNMSPGKAECSNYIPKEENDTEFDKKYFDILRKEVAEYQKSKSQAANEDVKKDLLVKIRQGETTYPLSNGDKTYPLSNVDMLPQWKLNIVECARLNPPKGYKIEIPCIDNDFCHTLVILNECDDID